MNIILNPTAEAAFSSSVTIPAGGHMLFALHGVEAGNIVGVHKIQVQVGAEWHDHISWSSSEPTILVPSSSESPITVRAYKGATGRPVGIRSC